MDVFVDLAPFCFIAASLRQHRRNPMHADLTELHHTERVAVVVKLFLNAIV